MSVPYLSLFAPVSGDAATRWIQTHGVAYSTSAASSPPSRGHTASDGYALKGRPPRPAVQASRISPSSRIRQRATPGSNSRRYSRQRPVSRTRTPSQPDAVCTTAADFLFTPSSAPTVVPSATSSFAPKKSASSPQLVQSASPFPRGAASSQAKSSLSLQPVYPSWRLTSMPAADSEDDPDDEIVFPTRYTSGVPRARSWKAKEADAPRGVTTSRDQLCAGETETELDEGVGLVFSFLHSPYMFMLLIRVI